MKLAVLDFTDLIFALGLIAMAIGLSAWQRLGLELPLLMAAGRALLQLLVMGYLIGVIFTWQNPLVVLAFLGVMVTIAALTARNRIEPKSVKASGLLIWIWGAMAVSTALTLAYTTWLMIRPDPWFAPQYLIPLGGIVIGNAMNGAALAGERLQRTLQASRQEIETHLCLGASPQQAIAPYRREAIRAGLIPTLNTMTVAGLVQLPGIFTGQLLSGTVAPEEAVSYQILIMFMLAFATLVAALLVTTGMIRQSFTAAAQLRA
jgi:putative ABC transport system permease protein